MTSVVRSACLANFAAVAARCSRRRTGSAERNINKIRGAQNTNQAPATNGPCGSKQGRRSFVPVRLEPAVRQWLQAYFPEMPGWRGPSAYSVSSAGTACAVTPRVPQPHGNALANPVRLELRNSLLVVRSTPSFSETKASCRGASVLFFLLERALLALVMLVNERHCVGDKHECREDDNDHISRPCACREG